MMLRAVLFPWKGLNVEKRWFLLVCPIGLFWSALAWAETNDNDWAFTMSTDVLSGHILQPRALIQADEPVHQVILNATHKNGLYGDVWVSTKIGEVPFGDHRESRAELTLGYRTKVAGLDVRTSAALFMVPKMDSIAGDTVQLDFEVSKTIRLSQHHSVRPYMLVELNPVIDRPDIGTFYHLGFGHTWRQGSWMLSNQLAYVRNSGIDSNIVLYSSRISYVGISRVTLSPLIVRGFHDFTDNRTKFVFGAGISTTF
jgi:hypothetical protein